MALNINPMANLNKETSSDTPGKKDQPYIKVKNIG